MFRISPTESQFDPRICPFEASKSAIAQIPVMITIIVLRFITYSLTSKIPVST